MPTAFLYVPLESGYTESSYWSTDIFQAIDGSETRKALMATKKYKWSYTIRPTSVYKFSEIQTALRYIVNGDAYLPLWNSYATAAAQCNAGTTFLCDTNNREYAIGNLVATVDPVADYYELRTVSGVAATYLSMTTSAHVYPATTSYVIPLRIGTVSKTNAMSYNLPEFGDITIEGEEL